ncbi:fungal-specific transcription factor domain-containing protein [Hypoxylon sp. FL1857]|nr:fungal-specific transcription factor domain-containing protein [Hypoxylon sp. FL1857]
MNINVGSQAGGGNTAVGPASPVVPQPAPTQVAGRKKGTSCARCRRQKIRCDDNVPSCGNCARVGQVCIRTHLSNNPDVISHINFTEARLRVLEDVLRRVAPEELAKLPASSRVSLASTASQPGLSCELNRILGDSGNDQVVQNTYDNNRHPSPPSAAIASPPGSTQIGPGEPLAHEVGLLSLASSRESKYLGPSSGVPFARLIFSAIPQSQGLAASWVTPRSLRSQGVPQAQPFSLDWTSEVDLQHFVDAYFETLHPLHPFIDEDAVSGRLDILYTKQSPLLNPQKMPRLSEIESAMSPMHSVQIFLIVALGARVLETRLSADFSSERYLATAQARITTLELPLHDSIEGLQIMLLLALSSFYFENGPNAWFLNSTIIASCLDLGLQRRWTATVPRMSPHERRHNTNIRSAIFWSAYSIERNLSVVLGRPLTLRDEAIDVEFPGEGTLSYRSSTRHESEVSPVDNLSWENSPKRPRIDRSQYAAAHYSFRLDRIVAEIKLMLHRVINLPERFPWPTDLAKWQKEAHLSCDYVINEVFTHLKWRSRRSSTDITIRSLELKYHHNLMLLHRPSPAIPQPTIDSWKICYNSAVKTIMIYSDLHRFSKLTNSWLAAHTVFVSGITFIYCIWAQPEIKNETSLEVFTHNATACTTILTFLGRTWSVATDAVGKFERLVHMTAHAWRAGGDSGPNATLELPASHGSASQHLSGGGQNHCSAQANSMPGNMSDIGDTDQYVANEHRNEYDFESTSFYAELGDMGSWFDLDWILRMNTGSSGEIISYPAP